MTSPSTTGTKVRDIVSGGRVKRDRSSEMSKSGSSRPRAAAVSSTCSSVSERQPASVGAMPAISAPRSAMARASATVAAVVPPDSQMRPWTSPAARGHARSAMTEAPPALWPVTVTRPGSPPKAAMLSRTHSRAVTWSRVPRLKGAPS
ncbi:MULTISPECIES: hypothetical protein [unclassified Actinomyces]|uniref:hypothetical protein n=1 Tax=Actinomyces sp. AC-20-1 TaxID=2761167 RepID=UPI0020182AF9|nr:MULTISPECIES: hypothetical protein [unclassified Actinomyces]